MTKVKTKTPQTVFQQLAHVARRVQEQRETADDIMLMMRHPHLAALMVKFKSKK